MQCLIINRSRVRQRTSWFPSLTGAFNSSKKSMGGNMALMVGLSLAYALLRITDDKAIGFQFAKVGNDAGADRLLQSLDDDSAVGKFVDSFPSK
jgi:hypothetical protein